MSLPLRTRLDRGTARTSAIVAAIALAATLTPVASADPVSQDDIDQAKANEASTSTSIADLEAQIAQLSVDSDNAQVAAETSNEDYLSALDELDVATADAQTAQQSADDAAKKTAAARSDLGQVVVETYQDGDGAVSAVAPYLTTDSWGDVSDNDVALTRAGENTDAEVQKVEALQAVADTMQSIADQKVSDKQAAADAAATAKTEAETAATNAQTAVTNAETQRTGLIAQLAEERNTTAALETKYQDQLEAERKAREEAAAKAAAEKAAETQAAKDEVAKAQAAAQESAAAQDTADQASATPSAEPTATASASPAATASASPTAQPTTESYAADTSEADAEASAQAAADAQATAEAQASAKAAADAKATADAEATAAAEAQRKAEEQAAAEAAQKAAEEQAAAEAAQKAAEEQAAAEAAARVASANKASTAVATAKTYLGVPYLWAGESYSGVDCSGLTMLAYQQAGVYLTHSSRAQYGEGTAIPLSQAQAGDLVFYSHNGTQAGIYHVAMYLGNGQIIEAPNVGMTVRITSLYYSGGIMPYAVRP